MLRTWTLLSVLAFSLSARAEVPLTLQQEDYDGTPATNAWWFNNGYFPQFPAIEHNTLPFTNIPWSVYVRGSNVTIRFRFQNSIDTAT